MPTIAWLIVLIGSIGNIIIGTVTFLADPKSSTNRWFGIFSYLFAAYLFANQLAISQNNDDLTIFWIRIVMVIAPAIVFSFFILVNVFPGTKMNLPKKTFLIALLSTIFIMFIDSTPLVFPGVTPGTYQPTAGILVPFFVMFNLIYLSWSVYILIKKYNKYKGVEKKQTKYFLIGALTMFTLILISNVVLVIFFNISTFIVLVPLYTLVFVGMVSYAIVRFRLFDVRIIATEATTMVLWIVLFANLLTAQNTGEFVTDIAVLTVVTIFGVLLTKSVKEEVLQKQQLEELNKKLKLLDEQKDEFVNVAAHELRAPMTAIKGYLSMIEEGDAGEISGKVKDYLQQAVEGNERLIRLVNNMLNVSRIEENRMTYSMGDVDLNEVVKTVIDEYDEQAEQKGLKLKLATSKEARYVVYVDKDRIYEVVSNLISNAIKYTDKGSITVKVMLTSTHKVRVEVSDTGTGMTAEEQKKLFTKFYRAESNVGKQIGTGLGLYIVKLLVDKFGGTLGVKSTKGKGSTFWFELPLKK